MAVIMLLPQGDGAAVDVTPIKVCVVAGGGQTDVGGVRYFAITKDIDSILEYNILLDFTCNWIQSDF